MTRELSTVNPNELLAVKDVFYELLEAEPPREDDSSMQANQQMALQMSRAVQEKGIVVFQNQSNVVSKQVIHIAIRGMKLIDGMLTRKHNGVVDNDTVFIDTDHLDDNGAELTPLQACANYLVHNQIGMKEAQAMLRDEIVRAAMDRYDGNQKMAAKALKVQRTYLCRLKGEMGNKDKGMNVEGGESDGRQDCD